MLKKRKERLSAITKQGDGYLRKLLVVGAKAVMRMTRKDHARQPWLARLLATKPPKIASVALLCHLKTGPFAARVFRFRA